MRTRRLAMMLVVVAMVMGAMAPASAKKPAGAGPAVVSITGGGVAQNNNSGLGDLLGMGGFNAKKLADDSYKGQIQFKTVDAATGDLVSQLHGTVVCLQPTTDVIAGGQGWEIRFEVTKSKGPFAVPVGLFGSIYVQDKPTGDMIDESFGAPFDPACGVTDLSVGWEPLLHGNIKVRS